MTELGDEQSKVPSELRKQERDKIGNSSLLEVCILTHTARDCACSSEIYEEKPTFDEYVYGLPVLTSNRLRPMRMSKDPFVATNDRRTVLVATISNHAWFASPSVDPALRTRKTVYSAGKRMEHKRY